MWSDAQSRSNKYFFYYDALRSHKRQNVFWLWKTVKLWTWLADWLIDWLKHPFLDQGNLFGFGGNQYYQVWRGTHILPSKTIILPFKFPSFSTQNQIRLICAGSFHSFVVMGTVSLVFCHQWIQKCYPMCLISVLFLCVCFLLKRRQWIVGLGVGKWFSTREW